MNPFSMNFVAQFAELLTTVLIHFVWQGAVLTLILLVTVKLLDVRTARLRYLLSVGTLLVDGNGSNRHGDVALSGQFASTTSPCRDVSSIKSNHRGTHRHQYGWSHCR